jgi:hypothetical protein
MPYVISALVHSVLEYESIILNPTTIQKLVRVERKFVPFLSFKRRLTNNIDNISVQILPFNLKVF